MSYEIIRIGTIPNDSDSDSLQIAGRKINDNFELIFDIIGTDRRRLLPIDTSSSPANGQLIKYDASIDRFVYDYHRTTLSTVRDNASYTINSSTGNSITLEAATSSHAGVLTADEKIKLSSVQSNAQVNENTNLSISVTGDIVYINSSTGSNVRVPVATSINAGFMSVYDKNKLDVLNVTCQGADLSYSADLNYITICSSTGTDVIISEAAIGQAGVMTSNMVSKLDDTARLHHTHSGDDIVNGIVEQGVGGTGYCNYYNGEVLIGNSINSKLEKTNITAGTGINVTNGPGSIVISNSDPGSNVFGFTRIRENSIDRIIASCRNDSFGFSQSGIAEVSFGPDNIINIHAPRTDLFVSHNPSNVVINSSTGNNATIEYATSTRAGVMSHSDKTKLDSVESVINSAINNAISNVETTLTNIENTIYQIDQSLCDECWSEQQIQAMISEVPNLSDEVSDIEDKIAQIEQELQNICPHCWSEQQIQAMIPDSAPDLSGDISTLTTRINNLEQALQNLDTCYPNCWTEQDIKDLFPTTPPPDADVTCDSINIDGGIALESQTFFVGAEVNWIEVEFNPYGIPDRMCIYDGDHSYLTGSDIDAGIDPYNRLLYDTGWRTTGSPSSHSATLYPGLQTTPPGNKYCINTSWWSTNIKTIVAYGAASNTQWVIPAINCHFTDCPCPTNNPLSYRYA